MKRAAMVLGVLAVAAFAVAQQQQTPAQQKQPAGAAQQVRARPRRLPANGYHKRRRSRNLMAYNAAIANQKDAAAMEKAADDFATKFPDSELRVLLFKAAMRAYQNANNGDKMLEEAQKLLKAGSR